MTETSWSPQPFNKWSVTKGVTTWENISEYFIFARFIGKSPLQWCKLAAVVLSGTPQTPTQNFSATSPKACHRWVIFVEELPTLKELCEEGSGDEDFQSTKPCGEYISLSLTGSKFWQLLKCKSVNKFNLSRNPYEAKRNQLQKVCAVVIYIVK